MSLTPIQNTNATSRTTKVYSTSPCPSSSSQSCLSKFIPVPPILNCLRYFISNEISHQFSARLLTDDPLRRFGESGSKTGAAGKVQESWRLLGNNARNSDVSGSDLAVGDKMTVTCVFADSRTAGWRSIHLKLNASLPRIIVGHRLPNGCKRGYESLPRSTIDSLYFVRASILNGRNSRII